MHRRMIMNILENKGGNNMSLLDRRLMMMMKTKEDEDMEWKTLFDETLTEDKNIVIDGLNCKEVEAYILSESAEIYSGEKIFLTSAPLGNVWGDPRISDITKSTQFVMFLKLEVINPYLWKVERNTVPYFTAGNYAAKIESYGHSYTGVILNKDVINGISVVLENGTLKSGTIVFIRGR